MIGKWAKLGEEWAWECERGVVGGGLAVWVGGECVGGGREAGNVRVTDQERRGWVKPVFWEVKWWGYVP